MQDFRKLEVWRDAHALTIEVYLRTSAFPKSELYGLTSQLRRSASSIGANLAEGCGRGSDRDFRRFVQIALGSASELEYHFILANDLKYLETEHYENLEAAVQSLKRRLTALLKRLNQNIAE